MKINIWAITIITIFSFWSCDGVYFANGTVYDFSNEQKRPLDSVTVRIYCGRTWLRDSTTTNSSGTYHMGGLTTPQKAMYYIIFDKAGFKSDTIAVEGKPGKTDFCVDHFMKRK